MLATSTRKEVLKHQEVRHVPAGARAALPARARSHLAVERHDCQQPLPPETAERECLLYWVSIQYPWLAARGAIIRWLAIYPLAFQISFSVFSLRPPEAVAIAGEPMTSTNESKFPRVALRVSEACASLSISRSKLYEEIAAGRLRVLKSGRRTLVPPAALAAWLRSLEKAA